MSNRKQQKSVEEEFEEYGIPAVDSNGNEIGKSARKKLLVKAKKDSKKKEVATKQQQNQKQEEADTSVGKYGERPLIQSTERPKDKVFTQIKSLVAAKVGETVLLRARLHVVRIQAKMIFLVLRQQFSTIQAVCIRPQCSTQMLNFIKKIATESIVDVTGTIVAPQEPIKSTSQQDVELQVTNFFVVSSASPNLPILLEDAERPNPIVKEQKDKVAAIEKEISEVKQEIANATSEELEAKLAALLSKKTEAQKYVILGRATRLDNRFIDLRTSANQGIMRISSAVCNLFREFLLKKDFIEIHTPKLLGTASEGGADVFKVAYFGGNAYLAQSPQLYKQMAISSDLDRVFEIGPVFRAENARTKRHMTEFVGLDLEMAIYEHYHEVLDVFDELFRFVFDGLNERFRPEIEAVRRQYPFEDLKYNSPSLKLEWPQAIKLLRDDGIEIGDYEDFSLEVERRLGQLVKRDYNVDFFMLDKFPSSVRPFYTMPSAENPELSNSYDFFIRGQEILSGAQRIHDSAMLNEKAQQHNVEIDKIQDYIDCFKYGAYPHAGGGIGLERVVMLFLDLKTVQQISMFPRTPTRLRP